MSQILFCIIKLFNHNCMYILVGDGRLGYPSRGPYDAIHVGAAAKEMPQPVRNMFAELFSDVHNVHLCITMFFMLAVDRSVSSWWTFNSTNGSRKFGSNLSTNRQDSGWQNQTAIPDKRGVCPAHR